MNNRIEIDEKKNLSDNPIKSITDNGSVQCVQAVASVMTWLSSLLFMVMYIKM